MFIDKPSVRSYLTAIADGDSAATGRNGLQSIKNKKRSNDQNEERDQAMTTFRNFAFQAGATLVIAGGLGVLLFAFAEYATRGVIV